MTTNVKAISGVGYLLVDMLRFWHSIIDCASNGLLPEISLLMGLLTPFWLLAREYASCSGGGGGSSGQDACG
jgi:hypothetical protein